MLPQLSGYLLNHWPTLFNSEIPASIRYLGVTGSVEGGTTTFLGFTGNSDVPAFAVKLHRQKEEKNRILNERDALNSLQEGNHSLSETIPRVIACEPFGSTWLLVLSILSGTPLLLSQSTQHFPDIGIDRHNFSPVSDWLSRMNLATKETDPQLIGECKNEILRTVEEFQQKYDLQDEDKAYLSSILSKLGALSEIGLCLRHGDFCEHNVLLSGDNRKKIGVIDWTLSRKAALPVHDLFFFLSIYTIRAGGVHGITGLNAMLMAFFENNAFSRSVRECVFDFCKKINVSTTHLLLLFSVFLIEESVFEHGQVLRNPGRNVLPFFSLFNFLSRNTDQFVLQ